MDARDSTELQELPTYEVAPAEPAALPLKEKLVTSFWIFVNTVTTLGLVFLSKRYACIYTCWTWERKMLMGDV